MNTTATYLTVAALIVGAIYLPDYVMALAMFFGSCAAMVICAARSKAGTPPAN